jgi:uncharacterized membrane protein YsdA (DUF1294 family)
LRRIRRRRVHTLALAGGGHGSHVGKNWGSFQVSFGLCNATTMNH